MFELGFLCMYGIGFFVFHILYPRAQFLEKIGLAFGIGLGLITFIQKVGGMRYWEDFF